MVKTLEVRDMEETIFQLWTSLEQPPARYPCRGGSSGTPGAGTDRVASVQQAACTLPAKQRYLQGTNASFQNIVKFRYLTDHITSQRLIPESSTACTCWGARSWIQEELWHRGEESQKHCDQRLGPTGLCSFQSQITCSVFLKDTILQL